MWVKFIVSGALGALTGWVTNACAVNMLFKKYWRFGGVIEKSYKEFVESMSKLVERDLVNHETLKDEFHSDKFKKLLREIIKIVLVLELPKKSGDKRLSEIAQIDASAENIGAFLNAVKTPLFQNVLQIYRKKRAGSIISREQFDYVIDTNVETVFEDIVSHADLLEDTLYEFCEHHPVATLLPHRVFRVVVGNVKKLIKELDLRVCDTDFDTFFNNCIEILDVDKILSTMKESIAEMRYADFVNDRGHLSQALVERALVFLQSEDGKRLLGDASEAIINEACHIKLKLSQLLPTDFNSHVEQFIERELPSILDTIVTFILKHDDEIDELINNAVDRELESDILGKILKFLKNHFIKNLSRENNLVGRIVRAIQEHGSNSGHAVSQNILRAIRENSVGDLIGMYKNSSLYSKNFLAEFLKHNLKLIPAKSSDFLDSFLEQKVGSAFDGLMSRVRLEMLPSLWSEIKTEFIYNDRGLKSSVLAQADQFEAKNQSRMIADFFNRESVKIVLDKEQICSFARSQWRNISAQSLELLVPSFDLPFDWHDCWKKCRKEKLKKVYALLQNDAVYSKTEQGILRIIDTNLERALTRNVSAIVQHVLGKTNPAEIRDMVKQFMGKELKPINTLGALLGGGVGLSFTFVPNVSPLWLLSLPVIYAATGIGTNHIALWMLFEPYEKKSWLPYITPGVVTKRKPAFAIEMARFVKNNMLNDDSLKERFHANKEAFKEQCISFLGKNNYEVVDLVLIQDDLLDDLAEFAFTTIMALVSKNRDAIAQLIVEHVDEARAEHLDRILPEINAWIINELYRFNFSAPLVKLLGGRIDPQRLMEYEDILFSITGSLANTLIAKMIPELDERALKKWVSTHEKAYNEFVKRKTVHDLVGVMFVRSASREIASYVIPVLQKETTFKPLWDYLHKEELNHRTKLNDAFGGILPKLLKQNISFLIDKTVEEVGNNRSAIKNEIRSGLNLLQNLVAGGRVSPIIDRLLDCDLPKYLQQKKGELEKIGDTLLCRYSLGDMGVTRASLDVSALEKKVVAIIGKKEIRDGIRNLVEAFVTLVAELKLKEILALANIHRLDDLMRTFDPLIKTTVETVLDAIADSEKPLSAEVTLLLQRMAKALLFDVQIGTFLQGVDKEKFVSHLLRLVKSSEPLKKNIAKILDEVLLDVTRCGSFYSKEILKNDLSALLESSLVEDREALLSIIAPCFKDFFGSLNTMVKQETKDEAVQYLIEALGDAVEISLQKIVTTIDLEKVIKQEIEAMHPREVKEMFHSFAGPYFNKLRCYGAFGGIFGCIDAVIKLLLWHL